MNLRHALSLLLLLTPLAAFSQVTCPSVSSVTPIPWDEARITWTASTWTPAPAPTGAVVVYTVYRGTTAVCTTTATATSLSAQPVGLQTYSATAKSAQSVPANVESAKSNTGTRTITQPPVVNPPTGLSVATDPTAYEIRTNATGTLVAARIGRVELGTLCSSTESQTVAGVKYNRVALKDTDLIVWPSASPNTARAWAKCS